MYLDKQLTHTRTDLTTRWEQQVCGTTTLLLTCAGRAITLSLCCLDVSSTEILAVSTQASNLMQAIGWRSLAAHALTTIAAPKSPPPAPRQSPAVARHLLRPTQCHHCHSPHPYRSPHLRRHQSPPRRRCPSTRRPP